MLILGEAIHVWGTGGIGELSVLSVQFCHDPKIALKIKFKKYETNIIIVNSERYMHSFYYFLYVSMFKKFLNPTKRKNIWPQDCTKQNSRKDGFENNPNTHTCMYIMYIDLINEKINMTHQWERDRLLNNGTREIDYLAKYQVRTSPYYASNKFQKNE